MTEENRTAMQRRADMLCAFACRGIYGARTQRQRMTDAHVVTFDLDFYAFSAWQLREAGRQAKNRMDGVPEIRPKVAELLESLDLSIPGLKSFRDQMTHAVDDVNSNHAQFGGFVAELLPGGDVRYVLDSRHEDHEALEDFFASLVSLLVPHGSGPLSTTSTLRCDSDQALSDGLANRSLPNPGCHRASAPGHAYHARRGLRNCASTGRPEYSGFRRQRT